MRIAICQGRGPTRDLVSRMIVAEGRHQIAWIDHDGENAAEHCVEDSPDLLLLHVAGVTDVAGLVRGILALCPVTIVLLTAEVASSAGVIFDGLGSGARDVLEIPEDAIDESPEIRSLLAKLDLLEPPRTSRRQQSTSAMSVGCPLVCVGASAGGPKVLRELLAELPADFPAAVVVVQHSDEKFAGELAEWLDSQVTIPVEEALDGESPRAGRVSVATTGRHLVLRPNGVFQYLEQYPSLPYCPSVDLFFESAARQWPGEVTGVILTGMGQDGARGLLMIREKGGLTIAQSREDCPVYGMPKAAAELGAATEILSVRDIPEALLRSIAQS